MLGKKLINPGAVACTTDTTQILDGGTTQSIALYRFEDNADDTSNSTGKFGKGAVFNGTSSYIDIGGNLVNNLTSITLSAWVYTDPNTNYSYIMHVGDVNTAGDAFSISRWNNTASSGYDAYTVYANIGQGNVDGNYVLNENTWYHIAVTWEGTTMKFYVNGNLTTTVTTSSLSIQASGNSGYIGRYIDSQSYNWKGKIDQVRIFNKALSSSEINTLYNETTSTVSTLQVLGDTSCIAAYTFEGNANDLSTNYNGTASNVTYDYNATVSGATYVTGKFGKAASYDGSGDQITASSFQSLSQVGISMWVNMPDISQQAGLITRYPNSGSTREFAIYMYSGTLTASIYYNGNNGNATQVTASTYMSNDTWHHIAYTANGSTAPKLYIDGVEVGSAQYTDAAKCAYYTSSESLRIGHFAGISAYDYEGKIDQVRIFDSALSPGQVNSLYNETATSAALGTITNPSTIAYYKMADATDETGSYNGTPTDVDFNVQGKYGFAGKFNGSSSKITISGSPFNLTTYSLSFWIYASDYNQSGTSIINIGLDNTGGTWGGLAFGVNANKVFYYGGDSGFFTQTGTTNITNENWVHVAMIVNGTSVTGYVNGAQDSGLSKTLSSNIAYRGGSINTIGVRQGAFGSYGWWNGKVDQIRVFNKAISADEVTKIYNEIQCANPIATAESYFNTVTYNSPSTSQAHAVGFAPDFIWFKERNGSNSHQLYDTIRTDHKALFSNTNDDEYDYSGHPSGDLAPTITSTGFTTPAVVNNGINNSGSNYVAWNWKAASSNTTNNDGTIASTVRASQESGFSIVTYSPNNTVGMSIGHGLSKAPSLVITKRLDASQDWGVYTNVSTGDTTTNWLSLNDADAYGSGSYMTIKSTTLKLPATGAFWSTASSNQVAYCFANIDGYQRIGSYVGNGSSNGPFIYTGFEPAWTMIKNTSDTGSWIIHDNKRNTENPRSKHLRANTSGTEDTGTNEYVNFYNNGFQLIGTGQNINHSGDTYLYLAIAANPDTTVPTKANSFKTKIYTGNGSARSITDIGFKPDFVWIKKRANDTKAHRLFDSVRGPNNVVYSNLSNVAGTPTDELTAFIDGGFSLGNDTAVNDGASDTYVAWNWKGLDHDRNLATINNDGSTTSLVSANTEAGFSIVQYTTTANFQQFGVGHGLSSSPQIIFQKKYGPSTTAASDWYVMTTVIDGSVDYLKLNATDQKTDMTGSYANFQLGNSTFSDWWTGADQEIVNYCFHSVTGYSSIGKYTGNASTTGPSITVGFRPSWVLIKKTSGTGGWYIFDAVRAGSTTAFPKILYPNLSNIEYDTTGTAYDGMVITTTATTFEVDFSSAWTDLNASGTTYLYMAFK